MSAKHTPGPWMFFADTPSIDPDWHIVTTMNRQRVLANVHIEPGNATDLANARLIASAPELLALAQKLASECGDCNGIGLVGGHIGQTAEQFDYACEACEACTDIRAVIAKASGEQL